MWILNEGGADAVGAGGEQSADTPLQVVNLCIKPLFLLLPGTNLYYSALSWYKTHKTRGGFQSRWSRCEGRWRRTMCRHLLTSSCIYYSPRFLVQTWYYSPFFGTKLIISLFKRANLHEGGADAAGAGGEQGASVDHWPPPLPGNLTLVYLVIYALAYLAKFDSRHHQVDQYTW